MIRKVFLLLLLIAFGCAKPTITTTMLMPAKSTEVTALKSLAVMPFEGVGGNAFTAEVEAMLASVKLADTQYFTVVDRQNLKHVLKELELSMQALTNPETAAKVGMLTGAKGIITGLINASHVSDSTYYVDRTRCAYSITQKDKKGKDYEICAKYETVQVPCTKRTAIFSFTPKVIDVQTANVLYSETHKGLATSSVCRDKSTALQSSNELLQVAKEQAKASFRKDIAPHFVSVSIRLLDSTEKISSDDALKKFDTAMTYAKSGRLDRACELWAEAKMVASQSPSILYNLGVCAELRGDYKSALDLYDKADKANAGFDETINSGILRVKDAIQKDQRLKEQLKR